MFATKARMPLTSDATERQQVDQVALVACLVSFLALLFSLFSYWQTTNGNARSEAAKACEQTLSSDYMNKQYEIIRDERAHYTLRNRAWGNVLNIWTMIAIRWAEGDLDTKVLRDCMADIIEIYCDRDFLKDFYVEENPDRDPRGYWAALDKMMKSRQFWSESADTYLRDTIYNKKMHRCKCEIPKNYVEFAVINSGKLQESRR